MMETDDKQVPEKNFAALARDTDPTISIKEINKIQQRLGQETVELIEQAYESSRQTKGDNDE